MQTKYVVTFLKQKFYLGNMREVARCRFIVKYDD